MKNMTCKCRIVFLLYFLLVTIGVTAQPAYDFSKLKREKLNRGFIAIKKSDTANFLTWRYLSTDPLDISFNIYRNGEKINRDPVSHATSYLDLIPSESDYTYELKALINGKEQDCDAKPYLLEKYAPVGYLPISLNIPEGGVTPAGQTYTYHANDASIGDVDGDGEYEIILKWSPTNAHDNSHEGYTGNTILDCYKLDGTHLWRIDLGRNIRSGAHYTQFMVYDLDGDGKAEIVMKTADGTIDGKGNYIGDPEADFRNEKGFILEGPEYLTVFNGLTGEAMETIDYYPPRGGKGEAWGDDRGNRVDRFLACIAYLDGEYPSVVMCRGYYTRTVLAAYDWRDGKLSQRWVFDSDTPGNEGYAGQGNHNLRVGDVDGDGCDEIIYGSCAINNDGTGLYTTGMGHGDAMHLAAFYPDQKTLQVWDSHENGVDGSTFRDAKTGEVIFQVKSSTDVGRAMAADIDPYSPGLEMWSLDSKGIRTVKGAVLNPSTKSVSVNMACWWDGDLLRELQDNIYITKYDYKTGGKQILLTAEGCASNNGSKSTPCLQGDILGDWREELLLRTVDNSELRLYISTEETDYRFHTFLEDPVYRISIATQNVAYNQPTQPGFYFGADLGKFFPQKEMLFYGDTLFLDAWMDYDSYDWSIGQGAKRNRITSNDIPYNTPTRVDLTVTYRGCKFTDYTNVTLRPGKPKTEVKYAGASRLKKKAPVVFLIGNSTMKNSRANGANGQWGWGNFFDQYFDTNRVTVENHALGGRSSRTFITEGLWDKVKPGIKKGDFVFIEFGHNDGGPLNTGRARASLPGTGNEEKTVIMERDGQPETIYTFGHYLRTYIRETKKLGAIPIVLSPTALNRWHEGKVGRMTNIYSGWAKQIAEEEGVLYIDANDLTAAYYESQDREYVNSLFLDVVHTSWEGAEIIARIIRDAVLDLPDFRLKKYMKKKE